MIVFVYFIIIASVISYIDSKKRIIPDKIILPALLGLFALKYLEHTLSFNDLIAIAVVLFIFLIPIILNMAFGGGDLRFGAFCALFVGLEQIGYFVLLAGLIHFVILTVVKKQSFGFAPAMSVAALISYNIGKI